ncbi:MAG: hypothetical protein AAF771_06950 [Pseudomonadota bacterium]
MTRIQKAAFGAIGLSALAPVTAWAFSAYAGLGTDLLLALMALCA